jgi:hypothetical protein
VCHRSSTACATCRHFRRSVAAQLGYCGLDRRRQPLRGDEIRGCWEGSAAAAAEAAAEAPAEAPPRTPVRRLEFVPVEAAVADDVPAKVPKRPRQPATGPAFPAEPGWNLWGEVEA